MPVGGDVRDSVGIHRADRLAGDVGATEGDLAAGRPAQPDEGLDQLVLPVARDARDAEDLAGPDLEVDPMDHLRSAVVVDGQARHLERVGGRVRIAAIDRQRDLAADHQLSEVLLVRFGRDPLADDPAAPDDRDPVGDLEDLVQLVADEDDAVALACEPSQDREDLVGLLRREDSGRLVEDEDPGIAVEGLEDLDPLLPADGEGTNLDLGIDLETEPPAELDDPTLRLAPVEEDPVGHRLLAEEDVLGHGQDGDQHEVLVDHVDATIDRVGWAGDRDRRPVQEDLALVRGREPVEDVHERRLAGAVLAEQSVDLAGTDLEVDAVVRHDPGVPLRDAAHLERRGGDWPRGVHWQVRRRLGHGIAPARRRWNAGRTGRNRPARPDQSCPLRAVTACRPRSRCRGRS